jgi:hypothetical protein
MRAAGNDARYRETNGYGTQWHAFPTLTQAQRFVEAYADYPGPGYKWISGPTYYAFANCEKPAIYDDWYDILFFYKA